MASSGQDSFVVCSPITGNDRDSSSAAQVGPLRSGSARPRAPFAGHRSKLFIEEMTVPRTMTPWLYDMVVLAASLDLPIKRWPTVEWVAPYPAEELEVFGERGLPDPPDLTIATRFTLSSLTDMGAPVRSPGG